MTDRYQEIRDALAMGPTSGPWAVNPVMAQVDAMPSALPVCKLLWPTTKRTEAETWANGQIIAACDPDTIRELLAERDQLAAALEAAREDAERMKRDIADLYKVMPMLPITAETMEAATDWFTRYCIDFYCEINAAQDAAIDAAMQRTSGGDHD